MSASVTSRLPYARKSIVGGLLLGAIAWALLALQIARVLDTDGNVASILVATAIPVVLSVTLFVGAIGVYRYRLDDLALRISGWTLLGIVLFSLVLGGELAYLRSREAAELSFTILFVNVAAGGAVLGFLIGLYDAHQRRLRRDLQEEYDHAIGLSQRLSVLARIVRHDLRNRLNVIIGEADRIRERSDSRETTRAATAIREAGDELLAISESIREFGAILEDPRPDHANQRLDAVEVVEDAIATIRNRFDGSVTIEVDAPEAVPVTAPPFLRQALTELLENAIVHNDADDPRVEVTVARDPGTDLPVEIRIRDNGPGISESELAVHENDGETQLEHSTGLGLWLVNWVVDASDGRLTFETADPRGTIVRLRLPSAVDEEEGE